MPGIDRYHRKLSYNSGLRKNVRSYKKVGIHIFEIFVASSFYLYMKNTTWPKFSTLKEYKKAIIRVLVGPAKSSLKIKPPANFHYLCAIPITEKKKTEQEHANTVQQKKTEKTQNQCLKCLGQLALCIDQYFFLYHKKIGVAQTESSPESDQN